LFYDLGLKKVPLKKSELKKGRRAGRGRRQEEGFSLFFREEYPLRDARILYEKKGREKGKETQGGGEDSSDEQVYIRLSPRTRLNNASSSSSSFRFPSLSLSVKIRERERD
jgi:hypothetical protein